MSILTFVYRTGIMEIPAVQTSVFLKQIASQLAITPFPFVQNSYAIRKEKQQNLQDAVLGKHPNKKSVRFLLHLSVVLRFDGKSAVILWQQVVENPKENKIITVCMEMSRKHLPGSLRAMKESKPMAPHVNGKGTEGWTLLTPSVSICVFGTVRENNCWH